MGSRGPGLVRVTDAPARWPRVVGEAPQERVGIFWRETTHLVGDCLRVGNTHTSLLMVLSPRCTPHNGHKWHFSQAAGGAADWRNRLLPLDPPEEIGSHRSKHCNPKGCKLLQRDGSSQSYCGMNWLDHLTPILETVNHEIPLKSENSCKKSLGTVVEKRTSQIPEIEQNFLDQCTCVTGCCGLMHLCSCVAPRLGTTVLDQDQGFNVWNLTVREAGTFKRMKTWKPL